MTTRTRTKRPTRTWEAGTSSAKEAALRDTLISLGSVVIAYSGGVDSAYLALMAARTLGPRALAVTAESDSYPERHRRIAIDVAREFGVRSPLDEVDLAKAEIRELSRVAGLPTWDEPASACLSSRIPYHSEVTGDKLRMIERGEQAIAALGFRVCRVRHFGDLARVEIGREELAGALEPSMSAAIARELKTVGFADVAIDPEGYRMGSLNRLSEGVRLRVS